jgi:glyoxylase-like metal-dependent hydrolase (beta-lactamase superfamily II)
MLFMRILQEGNLFQLTTLPNFFPVNCYLVEEDNELTLVDAALPFSVKGILHAAERLHKPITRILLTHAHGDHVGALDKLKAVLPDVQVYISRRDAKLLAGSREMEPGEPDMQIKGGVPKANAIKTKPDVLLADGDRIGSLQAIAVPGHTPGHMAFLDVRSRALIAGDAMQTQGGTAVSGTLKPWFPFPAFATWNKDAALESVQRLRQLSPTLLAVGHGRMISSPLQEIDKAIKEAQHIKRLASE